MRYTNLKLITNVERNRLYDMMQYEDDESGYRAKIILLKDKGYTVPEIRRYTNHHDVNIRNWIHRFNEHSIEVIVSKIHIRKPVKITTEIEKKIVDIQPKIQENAVDYPSQYGL